MQETQEDEAIGQDEGKTSDAPARKGASSKVGFLFCDVFCFLFSNENAEQIEGKEWEKRNNANGITARDRSAERRNSQIC